MKPNKLRSTRAVVAFFVALYMTMLLLTYLKSEFWISALVGSLASLLVADFVYRS